MSGNYKDLKAHIKRDCLMKLGHTNAEYLSDDYVSAWFNNYVDSFATLSRNRDRLTEDNTSFLKRLEDILIDYVILEE